jgi:hypothetical protein
MKKAAKKKAVGGKATTLTEKRGTPKLAHARRDVVGLDDGVTGNCPERTPPNRCSGQSQTFNLYQPLARQANASPRR